MEGAILGFYIPESPAISACVYCHHYQWSEDNESMVRDILHSDDGSRPNMFMFRLAGIRFYLISHGPWREMGREWTSLDQSFNYTLVEKLNELNGKFLLNGPLYCSILSPLKKLKSTNSQTEAIGEYRYFAVTSLRLIQGDGIDDLNKEDELTGMTIKFTALLLTSERLRAEQAIPISIIQLVKLALIPTTETYLDVFEGDNKKMVFIGSGGLNRTQAYEGEQIMTMLKETMKYIRSNISNNEINDELQGSLEQHIIGLSICILRADRHPIDVDLVGFLNECGLIPQIPIVLKTSDSSSYPTSSAYSKVKKIHRIKTSSKINTHSSQPEQIQSPPITDISQVGFGISLSGPQAEVPFGSEPSQSLELAESAELPDNRIKEEDKGEGSIGWFAGHPGMIDPGDVGQDPRESTLATLVENKDYERIPICHVRTILRGLLELPVYHNGSFLIQAGVPPSLISEGKRLLTEILDYCNLTELLGSRKSEGVPDIVKQSINEELMEAVRGRQNGFKDIVIILSRGKRIPQEDREFLTAFVKFGTQGRRLSLTFMNLPRDDIEQRASSILNRYSWLLKKDWKQEYRVNRNLGVECQEIDEKLRVYPIDFGHGIKLWEFGEIIPKKPYACEWGVFPVGYSVSVEIPGESSSDEMKSIFCKIIKDEESDCPIFQITDGDINIQSQNINRLCSLYRRSLPSDVQSSIWIELEELFGFWTPMYHKIVSVILRERNETDLIYQKRFFSR